MVNTTNDFFKKLTELSEEAFPKYCKACDVIYQSAQDFIDKTRSGAPSSEITNAQNENSIPHVELYRNCICGSTLVDYFSDRRDGSEKGLKRRALFTQLVHTLVAHKIPHFLARDELLRVLRGENSDVIDNLGLIKIRQGNIDI